MLWLLIVVLALVAVGIYSVWDVQDHKAVDRFFQIDTGVYRGHQPESIADYEQLKSVGIKTIINLREERFAEKERPIAEQLGFNFFNFAWNGVTLPEGVNEAIEIMSAANYQPVLIHCTYGKDRTGMLTGMYRRVAMRWGKISAWKEMWKFGFNPINVGLFVYYWMH